MVVVLVMMWVLVLVVCVISLVMVPDHHQIICGQIWQSHLWWWRRTWPSSWSARCPCSARRSRAGCGFSEGWSWWLRWDDPDLFIMLTYWVVHLFMRCPELHVYDVVAILNHYCNTLGLESENWKSGQCKQRQWQLIIIKNPKLDFWFCKSELVSSKEEIGVYKNFDPKMRKVGRTKRKLCYFEFLS